MRTPARSIATSTGMSGSSSVAVDARRAAPRSSRSREQPARAAARGRRARRRSRARPRPARRRATTRLGAAAADVLLRAAPCSSGARARDPRACARTAWRRAGSSPASCRGRARAASTPWRAQHDRRRTSGRGRPCRSPGPRAPAASASSASSSGRLRPSSPSPRVAERHVVARRAARSRTTRPTIAARIADGAVGEHAQARTRPAARNRARRARRSSVERRRRCGSPRRRWRRSARTPRRASGSRASMKSAKQRSRDGAAIAERVRLERHRHVGADPRQLAALRAPSSACASSPRGSASSSPRPRARAGRRAMPYVAISSRAPFSPMPGTPLMLSMVSPISASTSTT